MSTDTGMAWRARVVAAIVQSLEDVACAELATTSVLEAEGDAARALAEIGAAALAAGFAVARASLGEHGLHGLDALVRAFANDLRVPGSTSRGVGAALEAFAAAHGRKAEARFADAADEAGLSGDLRALAEGWLAGATGRAAARRLQAWLRGEVPSAAHEVDRSLTRTTAKAALAGLTRLARAVGARGTLLVATDGDAILELAPEPRDVGLTVLRELIDNGDGARAMASTKLVVVASAELSRGRRGVTSHAALASRLSGEPGVPSPHAPRISLDPLLVGVSGPVPTPEAPDPRRVKPLRSLLRVTQGLPPLEATAELTIGMDEVDHRLDRLFETASHDGSVFAVLEGAYGAGKTHHLLHIEARALAEKRPVFWLSVERLDEDLGNPQRHLRRLLEGATLPLTGAPGPLDRLERWLGVEAVRRRLWAALGDIAASDGEAASAARRVTRAAEELDEDAVRLTLGALDLVDKPANPSYRRDAYSRLHLWLELLARLDGCEGPVVLLDEAENLYRVGVSKAERRTGMRSLSFYCGGALSRACVVLAVTPESLERLREEADELFDAIEEQRTLLPNEDPAMLRRRLAKSRPIKVVELGRASFVELAERARALDERVRGRLKDAGWDAWVKRAAADAETPRDLLRRTALRLEQLRWGAAWDR
jgi:hypothetical protein